MAFVFSTWYIIVALLVVGIIACLGIFFKMDKKDVVLIEKFIQSQQPVEESSNEQSKETSEKVNE